MPRLKVGVLELLSDFQITRHNVLLSTHGGGKARGMACSDTVAHTLAGRRCDMRSRDAPSSRKQTVELLRQQGSIRHVMNLHLREPDEPDIEKTAAPRNNILELPPLESKHCHDNVGNTKIKYLV